MIKAKIYGTIIGICASVLTLFSPDTGMGSLVEVKEATVVVHSKYRGYGTGWAVAEDMIVTNYHVIASQGFDGVENENDIMIETRDGKLHPVKILKYNESYDLAILKVSDVAFKSLQIAQNRPLRGDRVLAIGYPLYNVEKVP